MRFSTLPVKLLSEWPAAAAQISHFQFPEWNATWVSACCNHYSVCTQVNKAAKVMLKNPCRASVISAPSLVQIIIIFFFFNHTGYLSWVWHCFFFHSQVDMLKKL